MPVVYKSICSLFVLYYSTYTIIRWTILRVRQGEGSLMEDRLGKCDECWGEGSPWVCQVTSEQQTKVSLPACHFLPHQQSFVVVFFFSPRSFCLLAVAPMSLCLHGFVLNWWCLAHQFFFLVFNITQAHLMFLVNLQPHPEDVYFIFGGLDHC